MNDKFLKVLTIGGAAMLALILFSCAKLSCLSLETAPPNRYSAGGDDIPAFPWPPPKSSAIAVIPAQHLQGNNSCLADVAHTLETALDSCGYVERSYYRVPKGFALVSRIEQMNPDGSPKDAPARWSTEVLPPREFSLASLVRALFTANAGHYRIIVFAVSSQASTQTDSLVDRQEAMDWLHRGAQSLPSSIGSLTYTSDYTCTALIYEFEQSTPNHEPTFKNPSYITGKMHLQKSGLWKVLTK